MTTQVIFTIDKKLKYEAMRKARSFGLPFFRCSILLPALSWMEK